MTTLRRRFLRWLILRFGADMTIVQNVDIGGHLHIPSGAQGPIVRGNRVNGGAVYMPNEASRTTPYHIEA